MDKPDYSDKSWFWMSVHEKDGWASTTKTQRSIAFIITTFVVVYYVIMGATIPALLPELLMLYFGIAVGGRIADRWVERKENKDGSSSAGSGPTVG